MANELQAAANAAVAAPLDFINSGQKESVGPEDQLDVFGPMLSGPRASPVNFHRQAPPPACTMEVQLGAVTRQVCQLETVGDEESI